jgi:hypothetical protein
MDLSSRWAEPLKEAEGEVDQWMAYWCRVSRKQVGQTSPPCAPARPHTATSTARRPAPAPPPPLHTPASPHSSTSTARRPAPAPPPPLRAPASPLLHRVHRPAPAPPPPLRAPASPLLHRVHRPAPAPPPRAPVRVIGSCGYGMLVRSFHFLGLGRLSNQSWGTGVILDCCHGMVLAAFRHCR